MYFISIKTDKSFTLECFMNDANTGQTSRGMLQSSLGDNDFVFNCIFHALLNLLTKGKRILITSHFPIHAPSAAGCEWDGMAEKGSLFLPGNVPEWGSCSGTLWEQRLYNGLVCFWQRASFIGPKAQRDTQSILSESKPWGNRVRNSK